MNEVGASLGEEGDHHAICHWNPRSMGILGTEKITAAQLQKTVLLGTARFPRTWLDLQLQNTVYRSNCNNNNDNI